MALVLCRRLVLQMSAVLLIGAVVMVPPLTVVVVGLERGVRTTSVLNARIAVKMVGSVVLALTVVMRK